MARVMWAENADIYRMKVEIKLEVDGKVRTTYYGPHDTPEQARDHSTGYRTYPKRLTKQKLGVIPVLDADTFELIGGELGWLTVSVKYRNGGEDVNWDDQ